MVNKASELSSEQLSALKCPSCTNVSRRRRDKETSSSSSSVLSPYSDKSKPSSAITLDSISKLLDQKLAPTSGAMIESRKVLIKEVKDLINTEMSKIATELRNEFSKTTEFIMNEVKDLKSTISQKDDMIKTLQSEQSQLNNEILLMRRRCSVIEKQSLARNIEVQCVPEDRNEDILTQFKTLCTTIKHPIADSDIHACRRVAKMDNNSKRPRNIVVTLTSPRLRDALLSAVHRFNKEQKNDKLNTRHIGLPGETRQIYVSEHLAPETKQLYAATRRAAKDKNYAFFWVKYGQIYLRKNDKSDAIRVKDMDSLVALK